MKHLIMLALNVFTIALSVMCLVEGNGHPLIHCIIIGAMSAFAVENVAKYIRGHQ